MERLGAVVVVVEVHEAAAAVGVTAATGVAAEVGVAAAVGVAVVGVEAAESEKMCGVMWRVSAIRFFSPQLVREIIWRKEKFERRQPED